MSAQDPVFAFIEFMRSVDCGPDESVSINPDDQMHRYRLAGDRPKTENGSYILRVDGDGFAVGGCMNFREQVWHKWHVRAPRKISDEDREAWKARQKEARERHERERAEAAEGARDKAKRIWAEAARGGSNAYLDRKGLSLERTGCRMSRGSVVVPMWYAKQIVGVQFIDDSGDKMFLRGCAKEGAYHAIAGDGDVMVIGEGLATMAAIHEALGCSVVVAFDAGNLKPVAQAMRLAYPDKRIIIAADNDQWTIPANKRPAEWDNPPGDDPRWREWREAGLCANTGADKAAQAAVSIGGAVVVAPPIPADDAARRTDWWDYWREHGGDAVREAFDRAMSPPPADDPPYDDADRWEPVYEPEPLLSDVAGDDEGDEGDDKWGLGAIRPLGYNNGGYYFLPRTTGQLTDLTATSLGSMQTLQRLAPRSFWEMRFGGADTSDRKICAMASSALMDACHAIGIYDHSRVRGVGAWMEGSDCVFNSGSRIILDTGGVVPVMQYRSPSAHLYPASVDVVGDLPEPMEDADAWEIVRLCLELRWSDPLSGYYLAGCLVTSILGGVMRWRPHVYLTGDRGAGKSTVMDNLVKRLLGGLAVAADGGSSEPGIRSAIINASRPVVMDEAEGNTKMDRDKMAAIMNLMRSSSSGGTVRNAIDEYRCMASFILAGINPQIKTEADKSRIALIHLRADDRPDADKRFAEWRRRVDHVTRAGASGRLISRLIGCSRHLPGTLSRIASAIRAQGSSARYADQHAALLAGVWLLVKSREPSAEEAESFLGKVGLTIEANAERDDSSGENWKVLSEIMTSDHAYDANGIARRSTIAAMVEMVRRSEDAFAASAAAAGLSDLGIEVEGDFVRIASTSPKLSKILRDTAWAGDGWSRHLVTLPGAREGKRRAFRGLSRRRTVEVPIDLALGHNEPDEVELPLEDWA